MLDSRNNINVLFIDHESILGGAEISMVNIIKYMPHAKVSYSILLPKPGPLSETLAKLKIDGIFYAKMDGWRWWEKGISNRLKLILSIPQQIVNTFRIIKLLKLIEPNIVHLNLTRIIEPLIAAKLLNIPTVLHCREHFYNNESFFGGIKIHKYFLNLCSFWIYNSLSTKISLEKFKSDSVASELIYNGVPISDYKIKSSIPINWRRNINSKVVLMAATIVPWKNHLLAIELAEIVLKKEPNTIFVFAGKISKPHFKYLTHAIDELKISNNIVFPGYIEDSIALMQSADILLHTSRYESFGKIYVEALATGIPIIAIKDGAAEEIIIDKKGGFLFNLNQKIEMADKIIELLQNDKLRINQGLLGQHFLNNKFSIEIHCEDIYKVYSQLIKTNSHVEGKINHRCP